MGLTLRGETRWGRGRPASIVGQVFENSWQNPNYHAKTPSSEGVFAIWDAKGLGAAVGILLAIPFGLVHASSALRRNSDC